MDQYLYVMQSEGGRVKVGISATPEHRRAVLESAGGFAVKLIHACGPYRSASKLERAVHSILSEHRELGEWFSCGADAALAAVRLAVSEHIESAEPSDDGCTDDLVAAMTDSLFAPAQRLIAISEMLMCRLERKQEEYEALISKYEDACRLVDEYAVMTREAQRLARCLLEPAQPSLLN